MKEVMLYKSFPAEFKVNLKKFEFEGYASTFGNTDSYGDIIDPGAFKKTISEFKHRMKVLWQHMPWNPIGKPKHLEEDLHGLKTVSKVSKTTLGQDVMTLLRDEVITELSIGFQIKKYTQDEDNDVRHIQEVKLWEYSPVTWGANEMAVITGAKNMSSVDDTLYKLHDYLLHGAQSLSDETIELMKNTIKMLQSLLNSDEPGEPTLKNPAEPIDDIADEPDDNHSSIISPLTKFRRSMQSDRLIKDLKTFGKEIKKG